MAQTFDTVLFTTDQSIDRLLRAGLPVLLVFSSGRASDEMRRALEGTARERAGRLLVAQADMRDAAEGARKLGVSRTPAVVDGREGAPVATVEGVAAEDLAGHARFLLGERPLPSAPGQDHPRASGDGASSAASRPVTVTDATFDHLVMRVGMPVLVDFWAPWCGPCRMTNPMLERLARDQAGKLIVAKVNVDENPRTAGRYEVQAVPTVLIVRNGTVVDRWSGALPESLLRSRVGAMVG